MRRRRSAKRAASITIRTGSDTGDTVYLEVRDTGCGMDAETRSKIFDPFFTTKFTGRGLGLAAVAGIARGHQADMQVFSAPGEGSTFRVSFPSAEVASLPPRLRFRKREPGDTVLVVDDEDMVRRIAQASLEIRGYKVVMADNGLEAIREVREESRDRRGAAGFDDAGDGRAKTRSTKSLPSARASK